MQAVGILIASVLLASATALGVVYLWKSDASPVAVTSALDGGDVLPRLERLEQAIGRLERAVEAAATQRTPVRTVSDEQLEAAVAAWMQTNAEQAGLVRGKKSRNGVRTAFQRLLEAGISGADVREIWKAARENGTADELLALFEEHAKNHPENVDAQVAVGFAYVQRLQDLPSGREKGMFAMKGDQAFDRALKLDPENWDARYTKSMSLSFWPAAFGKHREAIRNLEVLRTQQEGKPTQGRFARTYVLLGNLYSQQGKADKAKEAWQAGHTLFPDNDSLKQQLGK